MRLATPIRVGVFIGLMAAVIFWSTRRVEPAENPPRSLLADCEGAIDTLVLHYTHDARPVVMPIYRSFLRQLHPDVRVVVLCPSASDADEFVQAVGDVPCQLQTVLADHAMTSWSRDRWVSLPEKKNPAHVLLLRPLTERGRESWPARRGDEQSAHTIGSALGGVSATRSDLLFDGGDFVCDAETVFVTPRVVTANVGTTVLDRAELQAKLEQWTGKTVVLLQTAPDHHAGMFLMPVGQRRILVASCRPMDPAATEAAALAATRCDALASQLMTLGYQVTRIPVAVAADGRTYQTPLNAILDVRENRRIVYMPTYQDDTTITPAGRLIWESMGYEVRPVDCTTSYRHSGSLRCLVNIVSRRE